MVDDCGGLVPDYVGLTSLDKPFVGTPKYPGGDRLLTITPLSTDGRVKVEAENGAADPRYAISHLVIRANSSGRGVISFSSYAGDGWSTDLKCPAGSTRVSQINGNIEIFNGVGAKLAVEFVVKR
ncbi:hypothetical protein [Saccharothrix sp. ST-888]|uniref:hypothetical protein n=1 Tax=Saccharothrix sp. ST-888 TaxID=1427391 RepID=UPI000A7B9D4C|nr:hypothetical protein [Saccharothrix sp. ST-888]